MAKDRVPPAPLPPLPGGCAATDELLKSRCIGPEAHWERHGNAWQIYLSLDLTCAVEGMTFEKLRKEDVRVVGASVKSEDLAPNEINLVLAPVRGNPHAELVLAVHCGQKRIPLRYQLDLSRPPRMNAAVPIELAEADTSR